MRLLAPSLTNTFDLAPLVVGSMLVIAPGSKMKLPWLPDVSIEGNAWVVDSLPDRLHIHERAKVAQFFNAVFDMELVRTDAGHVTYTVRATIGGMRIPDMVKRFELVDAGRGHLELRGTTPGEQLSFMRIAPDGLHVHMVGPGGIVDDRVEPIIQPGESGYVTPRR